MRVPKHAVTRYAGESSKAPRRLRIDIVEALQGTHGQKNVENDQNFKFKTMMGYV